MKVISQSKSFFFFVLLTLCISSCTVAKNEPTAIFTEIKEKAFVATGNNIYWNRNDDLIKEVSVEALLCEDINEYSAVEIAILNNPALQAEYERIGIASAQYKQAGLFKNPFFMFNYQFSLSDKETDQMNFDFPINFLEILLIPLKKRAAQREIDVIKNEILAKIIETTAKTKIAFHNLQVNYEILELKKKICYSKQLAYEGAIKLRLAGNITELKLSEKHSAYEQAKLEVAKKEIILLDSKEIINNLLGLWGKDIHWNYCKKMPTISENEQKHCEIETIAIKSNLLLKSSFNAMKAKAASLKIDTTKLTFNSFLFGASGQYDENIWFIGPQFSLGLPIFDVGKVHSIKSRAEISYLWKKFISQAITIRAVARKTQFNYSNAYQQASIVKNTLIPLSEKILEETILQHNAMQLGVFAVLAAKESELSQKILFLEKEKEFYTQKIYIKALMEGKILSGDSL